MSRIRMVKPDFFDDPDVGELSLSARLFFIGLWTQADREGRLADDSRRLKARLFPFDTVDVEALLVELHGKDLIRRYRDADGRACLWIKNFTKHQRPHPKEPPSQIAACAQDAGKLHKPCQNTAETDLYTASREKGTPSPSESGVLILDSGTRNPESGTRNLGHRVSTRHAASHLSADAEARFERFWAVYPNKRGKDDARKAWRQRHPDEGLTAVIVAAVEQQLTWPDWTRDGGRYVPNPSTWLNQGRFEDQPRRVPVSVLSELDRRNLAHAEEALRIMAARDRAGGS